MTPGVPFVDPRGRDARTMTLLLVDDEPDIRTAIARYVAAALPNVRVLSAASGEQGLDALQREHVDVILTDFRMPSMNGLEFLALARALAPHAPRLMLTAYPDVDLAVRAVNQQAVVKFLTKPIAPAELAAALGEVLEGVQARDAKARALTRALGQEA